MLDKLPPVICLTEFCRAKLAEKAPAFSCHIEQSRDVYKYFFITFLSFCPILPPYIYVTPLNIYSAIHGGFKCGGKNIIYQRGKNANIKDKRKIPGFSFQGDFWQGRTQALAAVTLQRTQRLSL